MVTRVMNNIAAVIAAGAVVCSFEVGPSFAQAVSEPAPAATVQAGVPAAGCFVAPAALAAAEIEAFLAQPGGLLTEFPTAGLPMSNKVRSLAGSSADALRVLTGLVGSANPAQVAAIGAGLARAARACAAINPLYAAQIQEAVVGTPFETAFLGASAETQTAALGAPGAAGAAGGPAGAIGGAGAGAGAGGGQNGGADAGGGVASGDAPASAGAGSRFFASSGGGSTIILQLSPTTPTP